MVWRGLATFVSASGYGLVGGLIGLVAAGGIFGGPGAPAGLTLGFGLGFALRLIPPDSDGQDRFSHRRRALLVNLPLLLQGALLGGFVSSAILMLTFGDPYRPDLYLDLAGRVADTTKNVLQGALVFGLGAGLAVGLLGVPLGRPARFSGRIHRRGRALLAYSAGGLAFGFVTSSVFRITYDVPLGLALLAGVVFGLSLGLVMWFRAPVDTVPAASPRSTLRDDRASALTSSAVLGLASGLAAAVAVSAPVGLMCGLIVAVMVLGSASWSQFAVVRMWLAVTGRMPLRLMALLEDAHRLGLLRQVGTVYQFRHARVQEALSPAQAAPTGIPTSAEHSAGVPRGAIRRLAGTVGVLLVFSGAALTQWTLTRDDARAFREEAEPVLATNRVPLLHSDDDCATAGAAGPGGYRITQQQAYQGDSWPVTATVSDAVAVQVHMTIYRGEAGGVAVSDRNSASGYQVGLYANGGYYLRTWRAGEDIMREGYSPAIRSGYGQENVLTVLARHGSVDLFVNASHVQAIAGQAPPDSTLWLEAGGSAAGADVAFADLALWAVPSC